MWCSYLKYKKHISIGALTVASKVWKQRTQTFRMYSAIKNRNYAVVGREFIRLTPHVNQALFVQTFPAE